MQRSLQGPPRTHAINLLAATALKFATVGAFGLLINTSILALLYGELHMRLFMSSLLAVECSIVSNYLLNDRWTFGRRRPCWRLFVKFNLATSVVLSTTPSAVWLLVHSGLPLLVANVIGMAVGAALNFTTSTLWVWGFSKGGVRPWPTSFSPRSS